MEIARCNSINVAADNLYLSKSALSASIKKLEEEIGTLVLDRSYRGITLTKAGEQIVEQSSQIFDIFDTWRSLEKTESAKIEQPVLNIFALTSFANTILPSLLASLSQITQNTC